MTLAVNCERALKKRDVKQPVVTSGALTVGDMLQRRNEELRSRNGPGAGQTYLFEHSFYDPNAQVDSWQMHLDFLADLHLMAGCDGLVGKFTSNVDRIVLALMAVRRRCVPPYVSIDGSRWCFDSSWPWVGTSAHGRFAC